MDTNKQLQLLIKNLQQKIDHGELNEAQASCNIMILNSMQLLAKIACKANQLSKALQLYKNMLAMAPNNGHIYYEVGMLERRLWIFEDALQHLEKAHSLLPDDINTASALAELYEKNGQFEKALNCIKPFIQSKKHNVQQLKIYSKLASKFSEHQDAAKQLLIKTLKSSTLTNPSRSTLEFSLAELLDKQQQYEEAFEHFSLANQLCESKFNPDSHSHFIDNLIKTFHSEAQLVQASNASISDKMIFIVGMPRSGTTLVEQILASHSQVYSASELLWVQHLTEQLPTLLKSKQHYPQCVTELETNKLNQLSQQYINIVTKDHTDSKRIIDKMTFNFLHLGLVNLLFPQARVIHCTRNALDCCLSCYFTELGPYNTYSNDLEHIAHYFNDYQRLMKHWQKTNTLAMHTVCYENLVDDVETSSKELIKFCGLDWQESCLSFYKTKRTVPTGSFAQVREPIYKSSIKRWQHYEKHIQTLTKILKQ